MNPLTNMKNITKLSQQDLHSTSKSSWHDQYRDSAWIFIGGLPFDLTEGDIICIFSQYGEIVNINLIRAKDTGKSKGFCFLCYEDQRSTILAVDNFNGIKIINRTIRVDHVQNYKVPKEGKKTSDETKKLYDEGCAPKPVTVKPPVMVKTELPVTNIRETLVDQIEHNIKLPARLPIYTNVKTEPGSDSEQNDKDDKKQKTKSKSSKISGDSDEDSEPNSAKSRKKEKERGRDREKKHKRKKDKDQDAAKDSYHQAKKDDPFSKKGQDYKRSDRSRSRDREQQPAKTYSRGVSPSIPKRWR